MASRPKQPEPRPAPRLYLITPPVADAQGFTADLAAALAAGDVAAVLLRLAEADERTAINRIKTLAPVVQDTGAALLLEGQVDLVARAGADGAHLLGIDALSAALERLKPDRIAGAGGLSSRDDAMVAAEAGADYVMFGDFTGAQSPDRTLLEARVAWWAEVFELPCVAFATSLRDIAPLVAIGADFIALDCVWRDPRGASAAVAQAASQMKLPETIS